MPHILSTIRNEIRYQEIINWLLKQETSKMKLTKKNQENKIGHKGTDSFNPGYCNNNSLAWFDNQRSNMDRFF